MQFLFIEKRVLLRTGFLLWLLWRAHMLPRMHSEHRIGRMGRSKWQARVCCNFSPVQLASAYVLRSPPLHIQCRVNSHTPLLKVISGSAPLYCLLFLWHHWLVRWQWGLKQMLKTVTEFLFLLLPPLLAMTSLFSQLNRPNREFNRLSLFGCIGKKTKRCTDLIECDGTEED